MERPFVRLPQGGYKMFTDGKSPVFEEQDDNFAQIAGVVFCVVLAIVLAILSTKI